MTEREAMHARLFPPTPGNSFATEQQGDAGDPQANRRLAPAPMDMNAVLRLAAGGEAVAPAARPSLSGAQVFAMSPEQVAAYRGAPLPPTRTDYGGGERGTSAAARPRTDFIRQAAEDAVALQRGRRAY